MVGRLVGRLIGKLVGRYVGRPFKTIGLLRCVEDLFESIRNHLGLWCGQNEEEGNGGTISKTRMLTSTLVILSMMHLTSFKTEFQLYFTYLHL